MTSPMWCCMPKLEMKTAAEADRPCPFSLPAFEAQLARGQPGALSVSEGTSPRASSRPALLQDSFAEVRVINAEMVPRPAHGRQVERWRPAKNGAAVSCQCLCICLTFLNSAWSVRTSCAFQRFSSSCRAIFDEVIS